MKRIAGENFNRYDKYTLSLAPALYERAYEQLARPYGITVEQAVNRLVEASLREGTDGDKAEKGNAG